MGTKRAREFPIAGDPLRLERARPRALNSVGNACPLLALQRAVGNRSIGEALGRGNSPVALFVSPIQAGVVQRAPGQPSPVRPRGDSVGADLLDLSPSVQSRVKALLNAEDRPGAIDVIVRAVGPRRFPDLPYVKGGTFQYNPGLPALGRTEPVRGEHPEGRPVPQGDLDVLLGPGAFMAGVPVLYSTMLHEHAHIDHFLHPAEYERGLETAVPNATPRQRVGIREFLAYQAEIDASVATGLTGDALKSVGRQLWSRGWMNMSDIDRSLYISDFNRLKDVVRLRTGDFAWAPERKTE